MLVRLALVLAGNHVGIILNDQHTLLESNAFIGEHLIDDLVASHNPLLSRITAVGCNADFLTRLFSMESQVADLATDDTAFIHVPQLMSWTIATSLLNGHSLTGLRIVAWYFKYVAVGLVD